MPTLTRGSVDTDFFTAPYMPNDNASPRPITGGAPTLIVNTTTATTAITRALSCQRFSRSRKTTSPSAIETSGLMKYPSAASTTWPLFTAYT